MSSKEDAKDLDMIKTDTASADAVDHDVVPATVPVPITAEEDKRVLRKIDIHLQPVIMCIYFLVTLDKASLSYSSVFGIQADAHLHGNEYSLLGSVVYIAQLVFQPISALAIVKMRLSLWVGGLITLWGTTLAAGAAAHNFSGLFAMRFFLGALESSVAPCNVALGQTFYRRAEQGYRTCNWYAMNGVSTIIGSAIAYGLGHIHSDQLFSYQIIFLALGLLTVVYGLTTFFTVPDSIEHAYFLKGDEKRIATERVRFNQGGTNERKFNWSQALETLIDPKTWLWLTLAMLISIPSGGFSTFNALILQSFGFDKYQVMLLSMPVGAMQILSMYIAFWASARFRIKSAVILGALVPTIAGAGMLYGLGRGAKYQAPLLVAYYLTVIYVAVTPLLFAWHSANVAGRTKRTLTTAGFVAGQAAGNIIGPLLFKSSDAPYYRPGLRAALAILVALAVEVCITAAYLYFLNRRNERRRAARGMSAKLIDYSMMKPEEIERIKQEQERNNAAGNANSQVVESKEATAGPTELGFAPGTHPEHGARAFEDLTDLQNDEFIYVY